MSAVPSPPRNSNIPERRAPELWNVRSVLSASRLLFRRRISTCAVSQPVATLTGRLQSKKRGGELSVASLLWLIVVVLVVLWLIGLVAGIAGFGIHLLLVIALVVILYNLLAGRRAA